MPAAADRVAAAAGLALLAAGGEAGALEERNTELAYERGRYEVQIEVHLEAPLPVVWGIMTDYDRLEELDESLLETHRLDEEGEPNLVYTRMRDCMMLFCRDIERVERITEVPKRQIIAIALPERSDVRFAQSSWSLIAERDGTTVRYRLVMEPDFWIPPVIGPKGILRRFADTAMRMFAAVEARAAAEQPAGKGDGDN